MSYPKILLTILPVFWPKMPPLGLGTLQGSLAQKGIKADILDLNNTFYRLADNALKKEWLLSCNIPLENRIFSLIREKFPKQYDLSLDAMSGYDVIGFSIFKSNYQMTMQMMTELKARNPEIRIALGGPELARLFFKTGDNFNETILEFADLIVVGEGELPLYKFVAAETQSKKITIFDQIQDVQGIPFPKYEGIDLSLYPRSDALPILFSRGCVRACKFCSERLLYKGYRTRDVRDMVEEIRYHKEKNNISYFVFFDSLINGDLEKLEELCDAIIKEFGSINWEAQIAVRSDMDERLFAKMKKSGCYNLFVGLESGSDTTLKNMSKGFTAIEAEDFFKKLKAAGLFFGVSIIVGYPGETEADFEESLQFIIRNKEFIPKIEQVNPFTYYEGTLASPAGDYKINVSGPKKMERFVAEVKKADFKYTNAFIGNLMEKDDKN